MWEKVSGSIFIDVLDILIVAYLLYRLIVFIKDTRVIQMFVGLGLLLVLSFLAQLLGMMVVGRIIGTLQTVWVVAFIIIFQPELRAALTTLGLGRGLFGRVREIPAEQELLKAVTRLSKRGLGAIIVIEREVRLNDWIQKGVPLDAEITAATIEAIFTVPGPLHDGAVIISGSKIAAAAVILPITEREELGYVLGTRHRAAIGISEQSDAIVLVVSEETRAISLVFGGHIRRGLSLDDLMHELERVYRRQTGPRVRNRRASDRAAEAEAAAESARVSRATPDSRG
ncbi:MAG: TIGR00159 family protein [bacterium]|nr:TIGR00159 family protein [bacterium]